MEREDEVKNLEFKYPEFNFWKVYDEITRNREVIYKNLFDIQDNQVQTNLRIIYEKIGIFLEIKPSDVTCVNNVNILMREVAKIIYDYVPLKKVYIIDSENDRVEKINREVEVATSNIKYMVGGILNSLVEEKKKQLTSTCSKFKGDFKDYSKVRIWSAR